MFYCPILTTHDEGLETIVLNWTVHKTDSALTCYKRISCSHTYIPVRKLNNRILHLLLIKGFKD